MKTVAPTVLGNCVLVWMAMAGWPLLVHAEILHRQAQETLTAVELNHGDELLFRLQDGREFRLQLDATEAAIVEEVKPGGIVYRFAARVRVDGQPMLLERYVCSQESFYEPYVINGVRVWLDIVQAVFDLIPVRYPKDGNLRCRPRKHARFALQDARLRICPDLLQPWIEQERAFIDVGKCYNGDDCYLGPYLGDACHVGMDINQTKGSLLFAPLDFDTHAYFNSLGRGDNNNRWRGIRRWANGDVWALQTHHLIQLLVSENVPLRAGTDYATTAGVHVGSHEHTHFEFKVGRADTPTVGNGADASIAWPIDFDDDSAERDAAPQVLHLDPWIVFWQIFEDRRERRGEYRAAMQNLIPHRTGDPVTVSAKPPADAVAAHCVEYCWTFGDGGSAFGPTATHVFASAGVYPVTLVVHDGVRRTSTTQHISISRSPLDQPVLALASDDDVSFRPRPIQAMDVYGSPVDRSPQTLHFVAHTTSSRPRAKTVQVRNLGGGELPPFKTVVKYGTGEDWIRIAPLGTGNSQAVSVSVDAAGLEPGDYAASVQVSCLDMLNSFQVFGIYLQVLDSPTAAEITVDDRDPGFYATPWFWVGHRFSRCPVKNRGHAGFYLTNGGRASVGEFARFTPDLRAGRYEVSLSPQTPFPPKTQFDVKVRHAAGEEVVTVRPDVSRILGTWDFTDGADGFVQIQAGGSRGLVIADAVTFQCKQRVD